VNLETEMNIKIEEASGKGEGKKKEYPFEIPVQNLNGPPHPSPQCSLGLVKREAHCVKGVVALEEVQGPEQVFRFHFPWRIPRETIPEQGANQGTNSKGGNKRAIIEDSVIELFIQFLPGAWQVEILVHDDDQERN